nr:T9SS type A sorting domain-containing protein [Chitinophagaceae bacterium]
AQGSSSSSTIVAFENNFETLKVYPNPLHKRFNIQFPGTYRGNFTLQIVDQLGKIYEIGKYRSGEGRSNMEVDISNLLLKAGIYSLRIHSNNSKTEVIKLIIQ